ncbi:MAG: hypothetical protein WBC33_01725 [Conexibacter sp.]
MHLSIKGVPPRRLLGAVLLAGALLAVRATDVADDSRPPIRVTVHSEQNGMCHE